MRKIVALLSVLWILAVPLALADGTAGDYMVDIGTKFGRGLENTVTSLAEVPCTIGSEMDDRGGSGFFTGFGKGTVFMLRRMLIGVTEVGTFFIPMERTIPRVCQKPKPAVA